MNPVAPRRKRVAQSLRDNLSAMIAKEVKDPRVTRAGLISVNHVELNRDLSIATVYTSFYIEDERLIAEAMAGLKAAAKYLRGPAARMINLARSPELRFRLDTSLEFGSMISQLVEEDTDRAEVEHEPEGRDSLDDNRSE